MSLVMNNAADQLKLTGNFVTTPMFISAWIRMLGAVPASEAVIFACNDAPNGEGYRAFITGSGAVRISSKAGGIASSAQSTAAIADSNWHHIAGFWETTTIRHAWLDGGAEGTVSNTLSPTGVTDTYLGALSISGSLFSNIGFEIAHVAMWSDDQTPRLSDLARGADPLTISPQTLLTYMPLDRLTDLGGAEKSWALTSGSANSGCFSSQPQNLRLEAVRQRQWMHSRLRG